MELIEVMLFVVAAIMLGMKMPKATLGLGLVSLLTVTAFFLLAAKITLQVEGAFVTQMVIPLGTVGVVGTIVSLLNWPQPLAQVSCRVPNR